MEPLILSKGKLFHKRVQSAWAGTIEGKTVRPELGIGLNIISSSVRHIRKGRIDIFVDQIEDFVTIVEIKSTDWDKIKKTNRISLLGSHRRQLFRYIDKYLEFDKLNVCAGIIYPKPPLTKGLKEFIEEYFNDWAFQIVWFEE